MDTQICKGCGECKPLSDFYADPGTANKRKKECKLCYKAKYVANGTQREYSRNRRKAIYADPARLEEFKRKRRKPVNSEV